jgi:hypothetical protein
MRKNLVVIILYERESMLCFLANESRLVEVIGSVISPTTKFLTKFRRYTFVPTSPMITFHSAVYPPNIFYSPTNHHPKNRIATTSTPVTCVKNTTLLPNCNMESVLDTYDNCPIFYLIVLSCFFSFCLYMMVYRVATGKWMWNDKRREIVRYFGDGGEGGADEETPLVRG